MDSQEILKIIEAGEHQVYGIRVHYEGVNVGDTLPPSYDWDYENDVSSDTELGGTCALQVTDDADDKEYALELSNAYSGVQLVLIGGDFADWGSDDGEIIVANATALLI